MVSPESTPGFGDPQRTSTAASKGPSSLTSEDRPRADLPTGRTPADDTAEMGLLAARAAANAQLVRRQLERFNARDFDAYESALAADVEVVLVPFETMLHGSRTARDHVASQAAAFPDTVIEVRKVLADETGATVEFVAHGTHTGPLLTPTGTIDATGQFTDVHYCSVYEIEHGRIRCIHEYFDAATMMRQLGY